MYYISVTRADKALYNPSVNENCSSSQSLSLTLCCRNQKDEIQTIDLDPHFSFHFANAYEDRDGSILIGL